MPRQFGKIDASATWTCDRCPHRHMPGSRCPSANTWLVRNVPTTAVDVLWIGRVMPDGQWPTDGYAWWVRSHCGHQGGVRQWAFYQEADASQYEKIFRADPCHYTRCPDRIMIENDGRQR